MTDKKTINIFIAGGSGFWAECNHYPSIVQLKKKGIPLRVVAICDIRNPNKEKNRPVLNEILLKDKPVWINPSELSEDKLEKELDKLRQEYNINITIVSTNPIYHFYYANWSTKHSISTLCDKPLVTTKNASFSLKQSLQIQEKYEILKKNATQAKKNNPKYLFCSPLRRRALTPFVKTANDLESIYKKTHEGIRYMNVIVNGGVHKYPQEFLKGGAHGYLDGIGSLAHSSYHYIDVIAWYLRIARGHTAKIEVHLPYVFRVKDYLKIKGYKKLREFIESYDVNFDDNLKIPDAVLNSELDFTFHLKLLDKNNSLVGLISYTADHTTFTPRLTRFESEMIEYTNDKLGGRMSQVYIDIHQGALQNIQLVKNDVVFFGNNINVKNRKHPKIGNTLETINYKEAYDKDTITPQDLFISFIKYTGGYSISGEHLRLLSTFDNQNLTNRFYSKFYEKLAEEFELKENVISKPIVDSTIILDKYL